MKKDKKSKKVGQIEIIAERPIKYVEMDLEIDDKVKNSMLVFAKANILKDENALLNWAFITALRNGIKKSQEANDKDTIIS